MRPLRVALAALVLALAGAAGVLAQGPGDPPLVRGIVLAGAIDPVSAEWVERELQAAAGDGAAAVVIELDTPGGLVSATRDIVRAMQASEVPVAVWVGPGGARAGSAGAYIAAAADHVGMAPGTNIGSATPITSGGEDLDDKVVNDAAAFIAALAEANGRDVASYRAMVTGALNLTASEALAEGVIETVRPDRASFVAWLDGRADRGGGTLATAGAELAYESLPWHLRALQILTDPNLVFFLLLAGLAGLGIELVNPGGIVPGVVGAVSLLLALAGLSVLPFSWAGVAFLVLAAGLFLAETQVGGVGALAAGGVVSLVLGGLFLFDADDPALQPSVPLVILIAAALGGGFAWAARLVLRARRQPVAEGGRTLVGEAGVVRAALPLDGVGRVMVSGELWSAREPDGAEIPVGRAIRVVRVHNDELMLTVEATDPNEEDVE